MTVSNSKLIDPERLLFSVLGLITLSLPKQYSWQGNDINSKEVKGSYFGAFEQGQTKEGGIPIASLTVADVTSDATEPDVLAIGQADVQAIDDMLQKDVESQLPAQGRELVRWMSSHLNQSDKFKGLVTAYIVLERGSEWQNIVLRFSAKNHKVVVIGAFDIAKKEVLAAQIFDVMRNIVVID
jgi:hypothetical protein